MRTVCCGNESEQQTQGQVERKNESSDVIDTQYVPRRRRINDKEEQQKPGPAMPQYGKTSRSKAKEAVVVEMETVVAHVEEEDGEIIMEVEGQATDFTSEAEGESDSGSESDPDEGGRPMNNNVTWAHHHDDSQTSMESMDEGGQSQSTVDSGR